MFVIKGTQLPYRAPLMNGIEWIGTILDALPLKAEVAARVEVASIDRENSVRYAQRFVEDATNLSDKGRVPF